MLVFTFSGLVPKLVVENHNFYSYIPDIVFYLQLQLAIRIFSSKSPNNIVKFSSIESPVLTASLYRVWPSRKSFQAQFAGNISFVLDLCYCRCFGCGLQLQFITLFCCFICPASCSNMVSGSFFEFWYLKENLARVVRKADNAIHWINHTYHIYPLVFVRFTSLWTTGAWTTT